MLPVLDPLTIGGISLSVVLRVLDKARELQGLMLFGLLAFAAAMISPSFFNVSWIANAATKKISIMRRILATTLVFSMWSACAIWIKPDASQG
jgi:hypothetical protein